MGGGSSKKRGTKQCARLKPAQYVVTGRRPEDVTFFDLPYYHWESE
jgi:hypothetical protein